MTFLIFVAAFVALACLGLPLVIIGLFAALTRDKAGGDGLGKLREAEGPDIPADRFPGRWV